MKVINGKIAIGGLWFDNPLDPPPYPKRDYAEGRESARVSFRRIWLDSYRRSASNPCDVTEYCASELKLLSNGKCLLDGRELKDEADRATAREIFDGLKVE